MPFPRLSSVLLLSLLVLPAFAERRQRSVRVNPRPAAAWQIPACSVVSGLPSMRFVTGAVTVQNRDHVRNLSAASIAASSQPNVLYAAYMENLYESRDGGCSWSQRAFLGDVYSSGWYIVSARPEQVLVHNTTELLQIAASGVRNHPMPERMLRVFVNPANARHVRAIGLYGQAYESTDGGESWGARGDSTTSILYAATIDPSDFNHLIVTAPRTGVIASYDGGATWSATGGLVNANAFYAEFSPADPRVVWAVALIPLVSGDK